MPNNPPTPPVANVVIEHIATQQAGQPFVVNGAFIFGPGATVEITDKNGIVQTDVRIASNLAFSFTHPGYAQPTQQQLTVTVPSVAGITATSNVFMVDPS